MELNDTINKSELATDSEFTSTNNTTVFVYLALISLFSIPGNILILLTIHLKISTKSSTDYYVLSMATFDFLCGVLSTPLIMAQYNSWTWDALRSTFYCRLRVSSMVLTTCASTLLLGAVAVDRYYLTCKVKYEAGRKLRNRAKITGIVVAIISVTFSILNFVIAGYDSSLDKCAYIEQYTPISYVASSILMVIFISVFVTTTVCYIRVSLLLRTRYRMAVGRDLKRYRQFSPSGNVQSNLGPTFTSENIDGNWTMTQSSVEQHAETSVDACGMALNCVQTPTKPIKPPVFTPNKVRPTDCVRSAKLEKMSQNERVINKTTFMLFLISAVYITSWLISWSTSFVKITGVLSQENDIQGVLIVSQLFFLINVPINPIFYFIMSTKFRDNALELLRLKTRGR